MLQAKLTSQEIRTFAKKDLRYSLMQANKLLRDLQAISSSGLTIGKLENFARGYFLGKYGRQTYQEGLKISEDNFHLDIELKLNPPSDIPVVAYASLWSENYLRVDVRLCWNLLVLRLVDQCNIYHDSISPNNLITDYKAFINSDEYQPICYQRYLIRK